MSDDGCEHDPAQDPSALNDGGTPLLSRVFGALRHQRRRYTLYYLREHGRVQTDDLATHIAAWEQDLPLDKVSAEDAKQVKTTLVHTHLPKLDDYGFIDYDRRSGAVSYTHPPSLLDEALDIAATIENRP